MANLFTKEFEDKYNAAVYDKDNSKFKDKITASLQDETVLNAWAALKEGKAQVRDEASYTTYIDCLKSYFVSVCNKISAPGVDAFIEWLKQFGNFNAKNLASFRQHLIDNYLYQSYADGVDAIVEHKSAIEYSSEKPKLFDQLIKKVHKELKSEIDKQLSKPDLFEDTAVAFLESVSSRLEVLSGIDELQFETYEQLLTEPQKNNNVSFYEEIIEQALEYINAVKAKSYLGQEDADSIGDRIEDVKKFIKLLDGFGIANEKDAVLKSIFEKVNNGIVSTSGTLEQQWREFVTNSWNPLLVSYNSIKVFFGESSSVNIAMLHTGKEKWSAIGQSSTLLSIMSQYEGITANNPLDSVAAIPAKELAKKLNDKKTDIQNLESTLSIYRNHILEVVNATIKDYADNKLPMVDTIIVKFPDLKRQAEELKSQIEGLKLINSEDYQGKHILQFLSNDFDGFYEIYEQLDTLHTNILSNAGKREHIEWLNGKLKNNKEVELKLDDLTDLSSMMPGLMEVNIAKIILTKTT